ncbi:MAG: hypothetical protein AUH11_18710 [Acidobacteria bacterium 13_2_20CM_57_17]|nr:MAG: hypothetical protein AUH11_18710 [Acidobacteria bacterium 13_2_20CM_57_17]OLB92961.1 MAG: hypothetical protein AUI02_07370 [Acidobacteria bacterium 13_2_20CM_2_57_12]OLE15204.1 MAG: hypothetical protein AUG83_08035 [Acidobacteria bacterium 13_1_20CM_4_57_11]
MIRTTTNSGLQEFVTDRVLRRYSPIPFAGWLAAKRAHGLSPNGYQLTRKPIAWTLRLLSHASPAPLF